MEKRVIGSFIHELNKTKNFYKTFLKIFFTYLPFCLLLTEKIRFKSNIFTFDNRNRKNLHVHLSISKSFSNSFLMFQLFKLLYKTITKSNCYTYSYIPNFNFFTFLFSVFDIYIYIYMSIALSICNGVHSIKVLNKKSFILHLIYW